MTKGRNDIKIIAPQKDLHALPSQQIKVELRDSSVVDDKYENY